MRQHNIIIIAAALLMTACVKDIDYKGPDGKRMLIVNSISESGRIPVFEMSHSSFFLDQYHTGNVLNDGIDISVTINGQEKNAAYVDSLKGYTDGRTLSQGDIISVYAHHDKYGTVTATDTVPFMQSCTLNGYTKKYVKKRVFMDMFDDFEEPFDDRRVDSAWVVEAEIGHREGETDYYILTVDPTYTYYIYNDTLDTYDTITSPAFYKIPAKTKILLGQASEATAMLEETSADSQLESGKTFFIFDDLYLKDGNKVSFELLMQVPDTIAYIYTYSADSTITDITPYSTADKMKDHVIYNPNIKLYTLSRTYYYYYRSVKDFDKSNTSFMAEPVTILTNVQGGAGILATYTPTTPQLTYCRRWK